MVYPKLLFFHPTVEVYFPDTFVEMNQFSELEGMECRIKIRDKKKKKKINSIWSAASLVQDHSHIHKGESLTLLLQNYNSWLCWNHFTFSTTLRQFEVLASLFHIELNTLFFPPQTKATCGMA